MPNGNRRPAWESTARQGYGRRLERGKPSDGMDILLAEFVL